MTRLPAVREVCIDAGVGHARLLGWGEGNLPVVDRTVASGSNLREQLLSGASFAEPAMREPGRVVITGKLAPLVRDALGCGVTILPAAAAWLAARDMARRERDDAVGSFAVVDLSASGYLLVGVDRSGALKDDLLVVNPRCGAGSGINLDRVLQKLGLGRADVDALLADYVGPSARALRDETTVRADRCGVFGSSATISDKNQGIPLDVALATTLKSEVLKVCRRLPPGYDRALLTGRVFHWRFARACAEDWLRDHGVRLIEFDPDNTLVLESLRSFAREAGPRGIVMPEDRLRSPAPLDEYPAMAELKCRYEADHRYLRLPDSSVSALPASAMRPLHLALDAGSTMAKAVAAPADGGSAIWMGSYSNSGDTIETIKNVFRDLAAKVGRSPEVSGIGVTGSARYQVQQALEHIYPDLKGRVHVLVENFSHAYGSIELAREHIGRLKAAGVTGVNEDFCVLVDIGGEDTKISTIALREEELFGNAMNLKCSAGTGSLMDTLSVMFGFDDVATACAEAFAAPRGAAINATCAVFLMENARKLQLQGMPRAEILASANWAIVENMARTLWNQLELPRNCVVLLHGQTMLSEPLPIAVTHRMQTCTGASSYALVPPNPGHRACLGLIRVMAKAARGGSVRIDTARFIEAKFEKKIVQCRGAVCEDKDACCNRSCLTCHDGAGRRTASFTIGGCSAINELQARKKDKAAHAPTRDTGRELWDFIDSRQPRSDDPGRVVIPRSFAVSEWAFLLARLLQRLGLPVHVDNVRASDLTDGQPLFNVDTCAPQIGAAGQYRRLAAEPHGTILALQLERLPTGGLSTGHACTLNQGGVSVAMNLARLAHPDARFLLAAIDLSSLDPEALCVQFGRSLQPLFERYRRAPDARALREAVAGAIDDHVRLKSDVADLAAAMMEEARERGVQVAVVAGREYVLNPGIYDSHVRRLLRDKHMIVLPSYVLDLDLNPDYAGIYWRNPHFIVTLLDAISRRQLHQAIRHPRLSEAFRAIETGPTLLPVVQVSTFCCGPDSIIQPFVGEIMRQRPFLLIQSDAVIKELAHLENRVNTYVKQLELDLHQRLRGSDTGPFEIRTLDELLSSGRIDRATDAIYFPTLADNRTLTATLRGAGYTCFDNYDERTYDLHRLVRSGRRTVGDAPCAPLAAVYADLEAATRDFARRLAAGDPQVAGKKRLLYFDSKGPGPCRQGQYVDVHRVLFHREMRNGRSTRSGDAACTEHGAESAVRFLVGVESTGYDIGVEQWVAARAFQAAVLQGVLQTLYFAGGATCRNHAEFERFKSDFDGLKARLFRLQEQFHGPGRVAQALTRAVKRAPGLDVLVKYFAYRLSGREFAGPIRRFAAAWIDQRAPVGRSFRIAASGEVYMRISQSEEIFRLLLANLGFGRFRFDCTPLWSYLEYTLEESIDVERNRLLDLRAAGPAPGTEHEIARARSRAHAARTLQILLRHLMARPLYRAAGLPMPMAAGRALRKTRELIPTLRPRSEIAVYVGEAIEELRHGVDLLLNVGPNGCMVASMGEALSPAIARAAGASGRVQHLLSADGDVNEELLALAVLKSMGPDRYYRAQPAPGTESRPGRIEHIPHPVPAMSA